MRLLVWALSLLAAASLQEPPPGAIEGRVVDAATKAPLENAAVTVRFTRAPDGSPYVPAMNTMGPVVLTGADGRFRLEPGHAIPFRLSADLAEYVTTRTERTYAVKPGETEKGVVIEMAREASISGRVWDPDVEKPVQGVTVWAFRKGNDYGMAFGIPVGKPAAPDPEGRYKIPGLEPGEYALRLFPTWRYRIETSPEGDPVSGTDYFGCWYPEPGNTAAVISWVRLPALRSGVRGPS